MRRDRPATSHCGEPRFVMASTQRGLRRRPGFRVSHRPRPQAASTPDSPTVLNDRDAASPSIPSRPVNRSYVYVGGNDSTISARHRFSETVGRPTRRLTRGASANLALISHHTGIELAARTHLPRSRTPASAHQPPRRRPVTFFNPAALEPAPRSPEIPSSWSYPRV